MSIEVSSPAFAPGEPIPKKYTGEGADVSPPLSWSGVPEGTKELALICDDPDAPGEEPWVHWLIYKIPANVTSLPEGILPEKRLKRPKGLFQGANSWSMGRTIGYRGPLPPPGSGPHRYFFTLYALEAHLPVQPGLHKKVLQQEIGDHILAEGHLMGTYER